MRQWNKEGRPPIIEEGSIEEQLIADWMEDNMGFRNTTILINSYRLDEGKIPVSRSAVMNAFDRMDPKLNNIQKVCQGDTNNRAWALARKRQTKQLLIMQGKIKKEDLLREYKSNIPFEFDPEKLPTISPHQVIFFDEIHIDQEAGFTSKTGVQIRFPRDINRKYSPKSDSNPNPIYAPLQHKPSFKYTSQARFSIGVAVVKKIGATTGLRSKVFDYSMKRLISIKEFNRKIEAEIQRVKI